LDPRARPRRPRGAEPTGDHGLRLGLHGRIRIGCAALISPLHNPVHLAKSVATLDQLSGGRIDMGIATGGPWRMFSAFEVEPSSYVARFSEGVQLMQALWSSPRVAFSGRFWDLADAVLEPKPVQ